MFIAQQLDRLLDLGLEELTGRDEEELVEMVGGDLLACTGTLVIHPSLVPAARLAPLLTRLGKPGFVVPDMTTPVCLRSRHMSTASAAAVAPS